MLHQNFPSRPQTNPQGTGNAFSLLPRCRVFLTRNRLGQPSLQTSGVNQPIHSQVLFFKQVRDHLSLKF